MANAWWELGAAVALRQLFRGRIWSVTPATVVLDDGVKIVLWLPPDVEGKVGEGDLLGEWTLRDIRWTERRHGILRLTEVGERWSTLLFWDDDGAFQGWYVNLERPMTRSDVGFDFEDRILDLWVGADLEWRWLDLEEFERARQLGVIDDAEAAETLADAEQALAGIVDAKGQRWSHWRSWQPDASWPLPQFDPSWLAAPTRDGAGVR